MVVEIVSAERETLWYAEHIGVTIEVEERDEKHYKVVPPENNDKPFLNFLILKKDCKVENEN
jgi:hypothetical protein